jgi:hypothetical protein
MPSARPPAVCVAAALLLPMAALAARPLVTEDAGVLAPRDCELEGFGGHQRQDTTEVTAGAQVGCGVGYGTQATLGFTRAQESEEPSTRAVSLGLKTSLPWWAAGPADWAIAMTLGHERRVGGHTAELTANVVLVATGKLSEAFTWHANLGWLNSRPMRVTTTTWNLAGEWAASPLLDVTAECYGDDRARPWLAAGLRLNAGTHWSVNAAYGAQPTEPHARQLTAGVKLAF